MSNGQAVVSKEKNGREVVVAQIGYLMR